MFTGIIIETGKITKVEETSNSTKFAVETDTVLQNKKIGQSIAVNGVCVTITAIKGKNFDFEAISETIKLTNLKNLKENSTVNLEPALSAHQSLDGHIVQGHVDTEGVVEDFDDNVLKVKFHESISKYLAFKGSITINGVSLTISRLEEETFEVSLIPHTIEKTNFKFLKKGDKVNLEVDIIARYLERMLADKDNQATYEFLKERNLL